MERRSLHAGAPDYESFIVDGARLAICIAVQEDPLLQFFERTGGLARGIGFIARCLVAWPESTIGTRLYKEPPTAWPHLSRFRARIRQILTNAPQPDIKTGQIAFVRLKCSLAARAAWLDLYNRIEKRQAKDGDLEHFSDAGSKAAENAARLAALFHLYANGQDGEISNDDMDSAIRLTVWHLQETKRLLATVAIPRERKNAVELDKWLIERCTADGVNYVPAGDVLRLGPYAVRDAEARNAAAKVLDRMDRARLIKRGAQKIIEINPKLLAARKQ